MDTSTTLPVLELTKDRRNTLLNEFIYGVKYTSQKDLNSWGIRIGAIFTTASSRRIKNISSLVKTVSGIITSEYKNISSAKKKGLLIDYIQERSTSVTTETKESLNNFKDFCNKYSSNLRDNPRELAPKLAAMLFGFTLGSGGIDGDGGVPDLDFLGGIGAHRSIFTHSIFSGIIIETMILGFFDLAKIIHTNLPEEHDELWEEIINGGEDIFSALANGVSLGIAYHLGVDATIDGAGTYKDLPFSAPQETHQAIMGINAVVEGTDAIKQSNEDKVHEIENEIYPNFKEASVIAKANPGWVIIRASEGKGFRVLRKSPRYKSK